jgi:putative transcriptional regulator
MEVKRMRFSYNKLWKLLIDRGINKKTLREMSGISATSVAKLGKGGNVNTDVLLRICDALNCDVGDIMEFVREDKFDEQERKDALTNG